MKEKIVIVGGGMSGCFMAICLAQKGFDVEVYEERADPRKKPLEEGRSFNLTLYTRGIRAMEKIGVWEEIKKNAVLAEGNTAHYIDNKLKFSPFDSAGNEVLYTIHRNKLNGALLDAAEDFPNVNLYFNTKCVVIDVLKKELTFENNSKKFKIQADIIIGADGVNSIVRDKIQKESEGDLKLEYEDWGYKEVHVSKDKAKELNLQPLATHTWPRPDSLLIAFPNPDNSFTLMFNLPLEGANSFSSLTSGTAIKEYLTYFFPDLTPLISETVRSFIEKPTGKFITVTTSPWYCKDFMVLVGDSAHGVIPFYGQGSCAAFDDCIMLSGLIEKNRNDWEKIFTQYQSLRKVDTDILAKLSRENFIELRDKSRSSYYILKDKADTLLHRLFPKLWLPPLYVLIAHGTLPYSIAVEKRRRQEEIAKRSGLNLLISWLSIPLKKSGDANFIR